MRRVASGLQRDCNLNFAVQKAAGGLPESSRWSSDHRIPVIYSAHLLELVRIESLRVLGDLRVSTVNVFSEQITAEAPRTLRLRRGNHNSDRLFRVPAGIFTNTLRSRPD